MKNHKFNAAESVSTSATTLTEAEVRAKAVAAEQKKVDAENKTRTGKGTRLHVGQTRGKNPQVITWEAFDDSDVKTLPESPTEFNELTKTTDEKTLMAYLIEGFNSLQYTAASDPIAEYVEPSWDADTQKQFRIVVRNYANATNTGIEEAVKIIKPGIVAAQAKK